MKAAGTDVILVVAVQAPLPALERNARGHLLARALAGRRRRRGEHAARTALRDRGRRRPRGRARRQTRPFNLGDEPAPPAHADHRRLLGGLRRPARPTTTKDAVVDAGAARRRSCPIASCSSPRPASDRIEVLGAPVPSPLVVGPRSRSPRRPTSCTRTDGDLAVPDALRWMVDFDRAVAGRAWASGCRSRRRRRAAASTGSIVLGLRLSADAGQGSRRPRGAARTTTATAAAASSLLPQGTPTNNTEGAGTGFSRAEDADSSFDDRRAGRALHPRGRLAPQAGRPVAGRAARHRPRRAVARRRWRRPRPARRARHEDRAVAGDGRLLPADDDGAAC